MDQKNSRQVEKLTKAKKLRIVSKKGKRKMQEQFEEKNKSKIK